MESMVRDVESGSLGVEPMKSAYLTESLGVS